MLTDSTSVFIGTVASVEKIPDNEWKVIITFRVDEDLFNADKDLIEIRTDSQNTSCSLGFEIGQTWYIFSNVFKGQQSASMCGRSLNLDGINIFLQLDELEGYRDFRSNLKYTRKTVKRFFKDYKKLYRWY
ncbi:MULTISPECIES: hypothetical protein [Roseivirga]|uniref:Uncharacterized protein n=2 Tax=Roseivirga TaxID=290180 RepID=A0ABQ3I4H7_9BACT|nr:MULTISPECIES: hypothetical protein [Roseivirga]GHE63329.1 hypothetical protein GCM10011340_18320 [Roseivirga thermotolerans]|tara:strand:- start:38179 stop:38571 length:393 start_codon:yes stop_codon:yes gene_type:complete